MKNTIYLFLPYGIFSIFYRTSEQSWDKGDIYEACTAACTTIIFFLKSAAKIFAGYLWLMDTLTDLQNRPSAIMELQFHIFRGLLHM